MTELKDFSVFREELLADPEVKAAYDEMANEFAVAKALIAARSEAKLSQKDVAERMKTSQSAVARMESGRQSVSTGSIQRYATAVDRPITIEIRPLPAKMPSATE